MSANKFDSGHVIIPVVHPDGDIHAIAVPEGTDLSDLHDALTESGYIHPNAPTKEGTLEYSPAFRKTAQAAMNRMHLTGTLGNIGEVATYFDANGNPGPLTHSDDQIATVTHKVPIDAPYLMHTHPDRKSGRPSQQDIDNAKNLHKTSYVVSKDGLQAIDPSGQVTQVFSRPDWETAKEPK